MKVYGFSVNQDGPFEDMKTFDFVYLHGKLEKLNHFDLCSIDEEPTRDGIYDVKVELVDHSIYNTKLFFWHDKTKYSFQHGLIVEEHDYENLDYAKQKYDERVAGL